MSKNINKVGYKCMPGGNPNNRPILMKDGKVIDQDATVIEDKVIAESMRYISKMTRGLATGVLSQDEEYIKLQSKIIEELIVEKSSETRTKIETESKQRIRQYADAHRCHQKALDKMQGLSAQTAKENSISFFVNDENQAYRHGSGSPIGMTTHMGGGWTRIDLKELKKNIEAREKAALQQKVIKEAREKKYFTGSKPWMGQPDQLWMDDPEKWLLEMKKKAEKKEGRLEKLAEKINKATKKKVTKKKEKKKVVKKATKKKAKKNDKR